MNSPDKLNTIDRQKQQISVQTNHIFDLEQDPGQIDERWAELKIFGQNLQGRSYHTLNLCDNHVYTYGGYEVEKGLLDDFFEMQINDVDEFEWKPVIISNKSTVSPGPRRRHSTIVYKNKMYVFGGQHNTTTNNNDLFTFDFKSKIWEKIQGKGQCPPFIDSHSAAVWNESQMIIFGGYIGKQGSDTNSVYSFDFETQQWALLFEESKDKNAPQPRSGSGCVICSDQLYIFGGMNTGADIKFDDIWKFDLNKRNWEKVNFMGDVHPENRNGHSMILFNNYIFIFGGIQSVTKEKNDIYAFNISSCKWLRVHTNTSNVYSTSPGGNSPSKKDNKKKFERSLSPNKTVNQPEMVETNFVDVKKKQKQAEQKARMLLDIEQVGTQKTSLQKPLDYSTKNSSSSPTTEAIKNSIFRLGDQSKDMKKGKKNENYTLFEEILPPVKFKMGKKPCERDGQASCLFENKLLIFGGDRHLFSFNDMYFFDLDMALEKHTDDD